MLRGDWVVVYVMLDTNTDRIVASMRLKRHLSLELPAYTEGQPVNLLIIGESPNEQHDEQRADQRLNRGCGTQHRAAVGDAAERRERVRDEVKPERLRNAKCRIHVPEWPRAFGDGIDHHLRRHHAGVEILDIVRADRDKWKREEQPGGEECDG